MYVSRETVEQTRDRLRAVLASAQLVVLPGAYTFLEYPLDSFPSQHAGDALAFVRDEDVWSVLVPSDDPSRERFAVFSFHFVPGLDNSGFLGWLASELKARTGTGVMVVCGQNTARAGIFDYWGVPLAVADAVIAEVRRLRLTDTP